MTVCKSSPLTKIVPKKSQSNKPTKLVIETSNAVREKWLLAHNTTIYHSHNMFLTTANTYKQSGMSLCCYTVCHTLKSVCPIRIEDWNYVVYTIIKYQGQFSLFGNITQVVTLLVFLWAVIANVWLHNFLSFYFHML